jgi:hypothetical protein
MDRLLIQSRRVLALALAALIALPPASFAQTPAKPPAALPSAMQQVNLLFVQTSGGMQYDKAKGTLRMTNIASSTLYFTDRPVRMAGHYHTRGEFLPMWNEGPDSFSKNPPNATLSASAASAEASAAAASAAAAKAAKPPPAAPSATATQKLEQLKAMLNEGVISQAQYNKASQEVLNEVVK